MENGHFVISLDFELFWGVRDSRSLASYEQNILGVRKVVPELIQLFNEFGIQATFATVGFLFAENKNELLASTPSLQPSYKNTLLSPYAYIHSIGNNESDDPYHFASSLIKELYSNNHEIGCHTFCHYYCLEQGQTITEFKSDRDASNQIAKRHGYLLSSFIFPRNQYNEQYLKVCADSGITSFRGNENSWLYNARSRKNESQIRRAFRLIDAYFNISGHHAHSNRYMKSFAPINIPSSRFLRPYSKKLKIFDSLRLARIKKSMTYAARKKLTYHLWWHPHNFGINTSENLLFLKKILQHYAHLKKEYNFENITMGQLANKLSNSER